MIGQTISHYRILEKLGEGGMGVVYKAQDLTLNRPVALKFLPARLSASAEEKARLIQEAKAASALNHPNVATIHEIGEADVPAFAGASAGKQTFLVMEYIDGVTLREKVQSGPLKIKDAAGIALQAAEAIQKAHEQQIVHRDIKSDNIMITKDGLVKVMDFGLAKLKGAAKVTKTGSTVGTAAYMSPEQIQGEGVDHRTDIFSFGVVLYEMLAGRLPFRAEHEAALMYEIVNVEPPPLLDAAKNLDAELNRIVMKCLEKDRDERYQSMREVTVDLKRYKRDSDSRRVSPKLGRIAEVPERIKKLKMTPPLYIALAVVAITVGVWILSRESGTEESTQAQANLYKLTSSPGLEDEPSWSPDGKFLAYTTDEKGNFDIVVLPLGGGQPIWVADSPSDEAQPSWSPDGGKLAFVSARDRGGRLSIALGVGPLQWYVNGKNGDIFLVPALGGTPVKLAENGYYPSWSRDGKKIVFQSDQSGQMDLWIVPVEGGKATQLTNDADFDYHPSWSPDGKWIVYGSGALPNYNLRVVSATGGDPVSLTVGNTLAVRPGWSPEGKEILFSSARSGVMNIWKLHFNPSRRPEFVTPAQVTIGEGNDSDIGVATAGRKLAFAIVRNTPDVWEFTLATGKMRQVTLETSLEDDPRLSPDGSKLLIWSNRGGKVALWTFDLNGRILSQLTAAGSQNPFGRWSADGNSVLYVQIVDGVETLILQNLGDVGWKELVKNATTPDWSPDGKRIAFSREEDRHSDIWVYDLETGKSRQVSFLESDDSFPGWSPDGKKIAFSAQKGNKRDIVIVSAEGGTPRPITSGEAEYSHPQWSPVDADVILCLRDHKNLCLLSVSTGKIRKLTNFVEANLILYYPSWSFDGKKIYFSLARKVGDVYILENY